MIRKFQRKKYFVAWEITKQNRRKFDLREQQCKSITVLVSKSVSTKTSQRQQCMPRTLCGFFIPFHKDDVLWSSINNVHRVNKSRHGLIRGYERYLVPVTLLGNQITWKIPVGQKLNIELDVSSPLSKSACLWSTRKATRLNEPRILSVEDALWVVCLRLRAWWRDFHHNSTNESIIARWASV